MLDSFADKAQIAESRNRLQRLLDEADDAVTMVQYPDDSFKRSFFVTIGEIGAGCRRRRGRLEAINLGQHAAGQAAAAARGGGAQRQGMQTQRWVYLLVFS